MRVRIAKYRVGGIVASLTLVVTSIVVPLAARADTITNLDAGASINLASVLDATGLSVQIGDKLFDNFFFSYADSDLNAGNNLIASNVVLTALASDVGFGLSFQTPLVAAGNATKDIVLKYSVQVLTPGLFISDVHLSFSSVAAGQGTADVSEDVATTNFGVGIVGTLSVYNPGTPAKFSDFILLSQPQTKLWVEKDIIAAGNADGSQNHAAITIINQTFSQVPEPTTFVLTLGALSGLLCLCRRGSKNS